MYGEDFVEGIELGKVGCPKHGSSDSLSLYQKEIDGKTVVDGHCWSECGFISTEELVEHEIIDSDSKVLVDFVEESSGKGGVFVMTDEIREKVDKILELDVRGWKERKISKFVSEFYGVRSKFDSEGELTHRYYPSTENKELVGWHVRDVQLKKLKNAGEKIKRPPFYPIGKVKSSCELFGQSLFPPNGKFLVLASGEEDAQAIFQSMNVERGELKRFLTPVVSTTVGESALKQIRNNYDYICSFEQVIIMYDNDDAGKKGAEKVAKVLPAGLAKIAEYRRKDACEHTKRGEFNEVVKAFWDAEPFSPVDVLHLNQLWDDFENEQNNIKIPFPPAWATVNEMLGGGMERGEVTVIGALTSAGKSTMINNIVYNTIENTPFKVGAMYLEGTKREVVRDLLSLDMSMNLRRKDRSELNMEALKERYFNNLVKPDKFIYVDHQGSMTNDIIFDKLNYLAKVEACDLIVLDPLQAAVNANDNGLIIEFMDTILKFAKETDVAVLLVSHMRKPAGDDPHDVSEYHLMGSSSINQIAFNTILASRDKMHPSPIVRNSTKLQIPKCRRTGNTGDAGWLRYDVETTHLYPTYDPYEALEEGELDDFDDVEEFQEETQVVEEMLESPNGDEWEVID